MKVLISHSHMRNIALVFGVDFGHSMSDVGGYHFKVADGLLACAKSLTGENSQ